MIKKSIIEEVIELINWQKMQRVRQVYISPENWSQFCEPIHKSTLLEKQDIQLISVSASNEEQQVNEGVANSEKMPEVSKVKEDKFTKQIISTPKDIFVYENYLDKPKLLIIIDFASPKLLNTEQKNLLDKILEAIKLPKEEVTILAINAVQENAIEKELEKMQVEIILVMGADALKTILPDASLIKTKGQWFSFMNKNCIATYHPQFLINNPKFKRESWLILQEIQEKLGM